MDTLNDIKNKYNEIINSNMLNDILDNGREVATGIAKKKTEEVFSKVGFGRY